MIDLTPLDVRKKKGDFRRGMRGYDAPQVDDFLDLAAERMEELVRENATLRGRMDQLGEMVSQYRERERAMNEALISAQQLREDIRSQVERERELMLSEARAEAERIVADARRTAAAATEAVARVQVQRTQYARAFRTLVERQLAELESDDAQLRLLAPELPSDGAGSTAEPASEHESGTDGNGRHSGREWLKGVTEKFERAS